MAEKLSQFYLPNAMLVESKLLDSQHFYGVGGVRTSKVVYIYFVFSFLFSHFGDFRACHDIVATEEAPVGNEQPAFLPFDIHQRFKSSFHMFNSFNPSNLVRLHRGP